MEIAPSRPLRLSALIVAFAAGALLSSCGSSGGGQGDQGPPGGTGDDAQWDELVWDQDDWA